MNIGRIAWFPYILYLHKKVCVWVLCIYILLVYIFTMASYELVKEWALYGSTNTPTDDTAWQIFGKCDPELTPWEHNWGLTALNGKGGKNWSGILCEDLVRETLQRQGHNVITPRNLGGYSPDIETDDCVYEVKGRRYFMAGTASEKVLGVPYKYSDIPELYGKPLKIVCVAYQEWVSTYGKDGERVFGDVGSSNRLAQLDLWKNQGIEFVRFSKL